MSDATTPPAAAQPSAAEIVANATPAELESAAAALMGMSASESSNENSQTPPASGDNQTPPANTDNGGKKVDEANSDGKTPPASDEQGDKKSKSGIERLLEQRNAARKQADTASEELAALRAENEALKNGGTPPTPPTQEPPAIDPNKPVTFADLQRIQAEESQKAQDSKFLSEFPTAKDHLADAERVMQSHPTLTLEHAVRLVAPEIFLGGIQDATTADVNAGTRTPSPLRDQNLNSANMTQAQRWAVLQEADARGELAGI